MTPLQAEDGNEGKMGRRKEVHWAPATDEALCPVIDFDLRDNPV